MFQTPKEKTPSLDVSQPCENQLCFVNTEVKKSSNGSRDNSASVVTMLL